MFGADALAQKVDGDQLITGIEIPECPSVTGGKALYQSADLMDRAADFVAHAILRLERGIGDNASLMSATFIKKHIARMQ